MLVFLSQKSRRVLAGVAIPVLFVILISSLLAQVATVSADDQIQQANTELTAGVNAKSRPNARTRDLVLQRHERLIEMFTTHPERARAFALKAETRAALVQAEPSYDAVLEKDVPLTGQLVVSEADDFVHHTSTKHYSLHMFRGDRGLSFATTPTNLQRLTGRNVTVTGLSLPEVVAAETIQEAPHAAAPSDTSGGVAVVQSNAVFTPAVSQTITSVGSGVPAGSATALDSTFGNQTTAVLILKFTGSTATYPAGTDQQAPYLQAFQGPASPNVNEFLKEVSYNQTSMSTDVYTQLTVTGDFTCKTTDAMATAAITAGIAAGLDVSKYNHFVFVYPVASCYFGGLGSGAPNNATALIPHQYTYIWLPVTPSTDYTSSSGADFLWFAASQHEFGHNLGLGHSNSLDFGALSLGPVDFATVNPGTVTPGDAAPTTAVPTAGLTTAINTEYGDDFADMGNFQGRYNGNHVAQILGWIPATSVQDVTTSGSYTITPSEVGTGTRTLHVLRDAASSSWIWMEYHQPIGIYTPRSEASDPLDITPNNLYAGAMLHYQDGFRNDGHTYLLDMTPTAQPNKFDDGILAVGKSWSDPYSLLTITAGTGTANSLGMTVSYDTPCAAVKLNTATIPTAGGTGTVTITAPNSCNWTVSSNASWISFPGPTAGTGNGTVQFKSTANTAAGQRNSYITAQRQSLAIAQPGKGVSILPRTPVAVAPGTFVPLVFNIVDNAGYADLSELDLVIKGGTQPDCKVTTASSSFSDGSASTIDVFLTLSLNGVTSPYGDTGVAGTISNAACTVDAGASSYTTNGKNITLTLMVSFPASSLGVHPITGVGYGATDGITVPLSYVNVTTGGVTPKSLAISPAVSEAGSTVPFTISGQNTNFTPSSTVQVSGSGVALNSLNFVDAHTLNGTLAVSKTAATGTRSLTVISGTETVATVFTVNAATPAISVSPASGMLGAKVPVTITGTNTNFTAATTVTVDGTRVAANKVTYVSPTELTATIAISADAASGQRTLTVTTGLEVAAAYFTVSPAPVPHVTISPATGNQGDFAAVTITGTDTNFTDATRITIPGTDIKVTDIAVTSPTVITAKFTMTATATAGARAVSLTTGTEVVKGAFTVTAFAPTTTTIAAAAASIEETVAAMLTVTVKPTSGGGVPTGYVSVTETKEGLEDIVGTVQLSGGKATLSVSNLTVGKHTFSAQYLGDNTSFAQSKSTADAKLTVTADPGKAILAETATLQLLQDGRYEAILTIANSGKGTAKKVMMTGATLGGVNSMTTLPAALSDVPAGGSLSAIIDFPASAGTPGAASVMKFAGTFTGGSFTGSSRVTIPSAPASN